MNKRTGKVSRIDLSHACIESTKYATVVRSQLMPLMESGTQVGRHYALRSRDDGEIIFVAQHASLSGFKDGHKRILAKHRNLLFDPDKLRFFVDDPYVGYFDSESIRILDHAGPILDFPLNACTTAAISHPGQILNEGLLAIASGRTLQLFSLKRPQWHFSHEVSDAEIAWIGFDKRSIWVIDIDGLVQQFDLNDTGTNIGTAAVKFHPQPEHPVQGYPAAIYRDFACLSGKLLVIAETAHRIVVRQLPTMALLQELELTDTVRLLRFVDSGQALVVADDDGYVYVLRSTDDNVDLNWRDHKLGKSK